MIIYAEKRASRYIMHVKTYSRSITERKEHTNRKRCDNEGVSFGVTVLKIVCVSLCVFVCPPQCRVPVKHQHYVIAGFFFSLCKRWDGGKAERIKKKKKLRGTVKSEARRCGVIVAASLAPTLHCVDV